MIVGASPDWVATVDRGPSVYTVDLGGSSLSVPADLGPIPAGQARGRGWLPTLGELPAGTLPDPEALRVPWGTVPHGVR